MVASLVYKQSTFFYNRRVSFKVASNSVQNITASFSDNSLIGFIESNLYLLISVHCCWILGFCCTLKNRHVGRNMF